jgi:hypothetical protein
MEKDRSPLPKKPTCTIHKDAKGTMFIVPPEALLKKGSADSPRVEVWWSRQARKRVKGRTTQDECLILRQENGDDSADVVILTPGQVYDLIDALNRAVVTP